MSKIFDIRIQVFPATLKIMMRANAHKREILSRYYVPNFCDNRS